jgi:hypothetical protein
MADFEIPKNPTVGNPPVGIGVPLLKKIADDVVDYAGRRTGILPGGTDHDAELIPIVRRAIVGGPAVTPNGEVAPAEVPAQVPQMPMHARDP